jgi:hypothetical protein
MRRPAPAAHPHDMAGLVDTSRRGLCLPNLVAVSPRRTLGSATGRAVGTRPARTSSPRTGWRTGTCVSLRCSADVDRAVRHLSVEQVAGDLHAPSHWWRPRHRWVRPGWLSGSPQSLHWPEPGNSSSAVSHWPMTFASGHTDRTADTATSVSPPGGSQLGCVVCPSSMRVVS